MIGEHEKRLIALMDGRRFHARLEGLRALNNLIESYPHLSLGLFNVFMEEAEALLSNVHFIARTMEETEDEA